MDGAPFTFLCCWGGNVLHPFDGPLFANGSKYPLIAHSRWNYSTFVSKIYKVFNLDPKQLTFLRVLCRYPISFDHGIAEYSVLPIIDDTGTDVMFSVFDRFKGIGTLLLYVDMKHIGSGHEEKSDSGEDSSVNENDRQIDAKFICREIVGLVKADPDLKIKAIIAKIKSVHKKTISFKEAWCGKQNAIAEVYGDWKESYERFPRVLGSIKQVNPGTIVEYYKPPQTGEKGMFDCVFWAFGPCVEAFSHCRPVVSVGATFLHGKYKGVILIAMCYDANNDIVPLAFAIVEKNDHRNWSWFLNLVLKYVVKGREICLISDCHEGIIQIITSVQGLENVHHRLSLRHMLTNFLDKYEGENLKRLFWIAGCTHRPQKLEKVLEQIKHINDESSKWFEFVDRKKWTLAYDGGYRYGIMTINLSEVFDDMMKGIRCMPITAIIEFSFYRCVQVFYFRLGHANYALGASTNAQHQFSSKITRHYTNNLEKSHKHTVKNTDVGVYSVTSCGESGGKVEIVSFADKTCTCGEWSAYKVPCSHVFACCKSQGLEAANYVSSYYCIDSYCKTMSCSFQPPLTDEDNWQVEDAPRFFPNPDHRRAA